MTEEPTIKEEIQKLNENFEKLLASGKVKGFRMPSAGKVSLSQLKKNYVTLIFIGYNREIKFSKVPIEEGTTIYEKIPRLASTDYMLSYQGKPAIILPAWSVKPFSPTENLEEITKEKMNAEGHRLLLNRIESGKVQEKKKLGNWWIFPLIIGAIVVLYLIFGRK